MGIRRLAAQARSEHAIAPAFRQWMAGVAGRARRLAAPTARLMARQATPPFPHAKHEKLFPQCAGCHSGIPSGDRVTSFPDTALCGECHNNRDTKKVSWTRPAPTATNLRFSHVEHLPLTDMSGSQCTTCHATPDAKWMHVARPQVSVVSHPSRERAPGSR
jgi:hypothetical protein